MVQKMTYLVLDLSPALHFSPILKVFFNWAILFTFLPLYYTYRYAIFQFMGILGVS